MMIFLFFSHGASSSASGTRVVLPAPGGATSTAALLSASVRASWSSTASIGSGVSKLRTSYPVRIYRSLSPFFTGRGCVGGGPLLLDKPVPPHPDHICDVIRPLPASGER